MAEAGAAAPICVTLAYAPAPRQVLCQAVHLPTGSSLAQALAHPAVGAFIAQWPALLQQLHTQTLDCGVWGVRIKAATHILQDGDRLEFYRPLRVDPMVARRERFAKQGARTAGLFASRRPGAKSGY